MAKKAPARVDGAGGKIGPDAVKANLHPDRKSTTHAGEASTHAEMCRTLALVCGLDMALKGGYVAKVAQTLRLAGYTVADIRFFDQWWLEVDWRGQKNEIPRLDDVLTYIPQSRWADTFGRGVREETYRRATDKTTGEIIHYIANKDGSLTEFGRSLPRRKRTGQ